MRVVKVGGAALSKEKLKLAIIGSPLMPVAKTEHYSLTEV
jgi:hypothetical protein